MFSKYCKILLQCLTRSVLPILFASQVPLPVSCCIPIQMRSDKRIRIGQLPCVSYRPHLLSTWHNVWCFICQGDAGCLKFCWPSLTLVQKKALIQPFLNVHTYNLHQWLPRNLAFLVDMLILTFE